MDAQRLFKSLLTRNMRAASRDVCRVEIWRGGT